jgi:hypothetical protein
VDPCGPEGSVSSDPSPEPVCGGFRPFDSARDRVAGSPAEDKSLYLLYAVGRLDVTVDIRTNALGDLLHRIQEVARHGALSCQRYTCRGHDEDGCEHRSDATTDAEPRANR